jgi:hypothetical protein
MTVCCYGIRNLFAVSRSDMFMNRWEVALQEWRIYNGVRRKLCQNSTSCRRQSIKNGKQARGIS